MNHFTKLSIELASQRDYLDQLFRVYPLAPDSIRNVDPTVWEEVKTAFDGGKNVDLVKSLLKLKLFPIKDGYVPFLRRLPGAIDLNPKTVNRIAGRIRELGLDKLYEQCAQPKETNRQMGPLFRQWIDNGVLGFPVVNLDEFMANDDDAILRGSDSALKQFAENNLGYTRNKGLDFIARINKKYVIGEAKFISDEGGHQNDQFLDAMYTLKTKVNKGVVKIAILDGILYIPSRSKMYKQIAGSNLKVMSALMLREFLNTL